MQPRMWLVIRKYRPNRVVNITVAEQEPRGYTESTMAGPKLSLAETLIRLRQASGLSVRQLEESSGVARSVISRIEHGEYRQPTPSTLSRLAKALNAEASELLTAAGYTASEAEALPAIRPYLRTKYGHLSASAQRELATVLERLEAEQGSKRAGGNKSK